MGENSTKVRVRIAPSPTGFAHLGTAYVTLLNFAFAKKNRGSLILRLDDTDTKRHVEAAEELIYSTLAWLGFSWDEGPDEGGDFGPYRQSEKLAVYKEKAQDLIRENKAFEDEGAIRFRNPGLDISWNDLIGGEITFPGSEVGDWVMVRSDGYPTYNFATVVDDYLMQITHVIRGEEHISNTPRQIALFNAFGYNLPFFAHFPTLRNIERKKLSKRRDPVNLALYREAGYLPEALVNYLALLGWSHPQGKEIFSLDEFVEVFDLSRVRRAGPVFDAQKLDWINGMYLRKMDIAKFSQLVNQHCSFGVTGEMAKLIKERITKLSEAEELLRFFFEEPQVGKELFDKLESLEHISKALVVLNRVEDWDLGNINSSLSALIGEESFKTGEFYMNLRLALTARRITPPINESMVILGKDRVSLRLEKARNVLLEPE